MRRSGSGRYLRGRRRRTPSRTSMSSWSSAWAARRSSPRGEVTVCLATPRPIYLPVVDWWSSEEVHVTIGLISHRIWWRRREVRD
jgi:hypothetical protein